MPWPNPLTGVEIGAMGTGIGNNLGKTIGQFFRNRRLSDALASDMPLAEMVLRDLASPKYLEIGYGDQPFRKAFGVMGTPASSSSGPKVPPTSPLPDLEDEDESELEPFSGASPRF